jgi:hypothetical protein
MRAARAQSDRAGGAISRRAALGGLGLALAGCRARIPESSPVRVSPPPMPATTGAPAPAGLATREAGEAAASAPLLVRRTPTPPPLDGGLTGSWQVATPLLLALSWGIRGSAHAFDLELRALYDDSSVYLLARWQDTAPAMGNGATANKITMHWSIPQAGLVPPDCAVACHTAYVRSDGSLAYVNSETIPQGPNELLPSGGGWQAGMWALAWSRPLLDDNPFDLQFDDLSRPYIFFVKVFEGRPGRADAVSDRHQLRFQR